MIQGFPEGGNYKVMVQCCTYNQSRYIEDTLNGFVMQQTDFPFVCCAYFTYEGYSTCLSVSWCRTQMY